MVYKIAADLIVLFHLLWIGFLIFGALLAFKRPWLRALHLAGLAFSVSMQTYGWYCPLTHAEQWLHSRYRPELSYTGSFIAHYAERLVYLRVPPLLVLALTLLICAGTAYIYLRWSPARHEGRAKSA
ncbi:hypothetical protein NKDENANG_01346 [Candidatus Entotheonellaceae bacterium PAL068K]